MGANVPSIKGSAFRSVREDVKRLVDQGRIDPEELLSFLSDKDRELLDTVITPVSWVPIETYAHMLELLALEEGGNDTIRYLRDRGARAAEQLLSGTYQSFAAEPGTWGRHVGEAMMGMGKLLYNFSDWSFHVETDDVCEIRVTDALHFLDPARFTAEGFLKWFAEHAADRPMRVESSRPSPDRVVIRLESV
jgi:hypothetical protein